MLWKGIIISNLLRTVADAIILLGDFVEGVYMTYKAWIHSVFSEQQYQERKNCAVRKRLMCIVAALLACLCFAWAKAIDVGISLCDASTARGVAVAQNILRSFESASISTCILDAGGKASQQVLDIEALIDAKPEYLVISSARSLGLGEVIHKAAQMGIKVILVDQYVKDAQNDDVFAQVGIDWEWAAQACVNALMERAGNRPIAILEITGSAGSSATNDLSKYFRKAIRNVENAHIAGVLNGGGDRQTANQALAYFIAEKGRCFDAVFAHGDEQALGAINALMNIPEMDNLPIVCVGGLDDVLRALAAGKMYACAAMEADYGNAILQIVEADRLGKDVSRTVSFEGTLLLTNEMEEQ